jgi:hypothetical protein
MARYAFGILAIVLAASGADARSETSAQDGALAKPECARAADEAFAEAENAGRNFARSQPELAGDYWMILARHKKNWIAECEAGQPLQRPLLQH